MNHFAVALEVRRVLAVVLKRPVEEGDFVSRETESAWDSLKHVEIVLGIEGALGIQFREEELGALTDVERLIRAAESCLAA